MDDAFLDQLAAQAIAEHNATHKAQAAPGAILDRLGDVLKWLRDNGVKLLPLLAKLPQLIAILSGGGDFLAIIQAIIALFNLAPTTPPLTL